MRFPEEFRRETVNAVGFISILFEGAARIRMLRRLEQRS